MAAGRTTVEVEGRRLSLSNLDKVLYPATGTTKGEVLNYYTRAAPAFLAHVAGRPVTFRRAPDGIEGQVFFEKNVPRGAPPWVRTIHIESRRSGRRTVDDAEEGGRRRTGTGAPIDYPAIGDLPSLVWAVNLAVLEFHVPMWCVDDRGKPQAPDLIVFDLDPGAPADLVQCCDVALRLRDALTADGFDPRPKTSGGKGMQLYARWASPDHEDQPIGYAQELARRLEREDPGLVVSNMRKDLRRGKVLIDWSQNNPAKTTVAPYSLRLAASPGVSTPLHWDEVTAGADGDTAPLQFTPDDVLERLDAEGDLFVDG
jgi:bifunctional non-homologous end joining protein LigD